MEDVAGWHGKAPNDEEYKTAMDELKARLAEVEGCKMADVKKIAPGQLWQRAG